MNHSLIVLASNNRGKLAEFEAILGPLGYELRAQKDYAVPEADEPYYSFIENALAKARHTSKHTGLPALADDSGLCVQALNGKPGVLSARFAADHLQLAGESADARNNALLLSLMQGIDNRQACFVAALAYVRHAHDPLPIVVQGFWWGEIAHEPLGDQGFGYDPIFWLPEQQKTVAQLSAKQKNSLSHRAQALRHFIKQLPNHVEA